MKERGRENYFPEKRVIAAHCKSLYSTGMSRDDRVEQIRESENRLAQNWKKLDQKKTKEEREL